MDAVETGSLSGLGGEIVAAGLAAMDHILVGLMLLGAADEIRHLNAAARRIVAAQDGILCCGRRLRMPGAGEGGWLRPGVEPGREWSFRVQRPSGAPDYIVTVLPTDPESPAHSLIARAMLITDPAAIEVRPELLIRIWGLTGAEARVAAALAAGLAPAEIAVRHGVSDATVRTQLRAIFDKTGTHRQSELIRVLASLHV